MTATEVRATKPPPLVEYLIDIGLLSPDEVVKRQVAFEEISMSHAAFRLSVDGQARAFVKQCDPVRSLGRDLAAEAAVYRIATWDPSLTSVLPACLAISPDDTILVLESLPVPAEGSLWPFSGPVSLGPAGDSALRAYGQALATVHAVRPPPFGEVPWLLWGLRSDVLTAPDLPPAVRRLYQHVVAQPMLRRGIDTAAQAWRSTGLIHGDLRWTNVLPDIAPSGQTTRVWLVDWELACVGDQAWDVGSVVADLIAAHMGNAGDSATTDGALDRAKPFLSTYQAAAGLRGRRWHDLLIRAVRNAGLRLIQTISEYGYVDPSQMTSIQSVLLPWSGWLLGQPEPVARHLVESVGS